MILESFTVWSTWHVLESLEANQGLQCLLRISKLSYLVFTSYRSRFAREVESRVDASRQPDANIEEIEAGEEALEQMNKITNLVILRRTSQHINQFLPPKTVYIVFCKATPYQEKLYRSILDQMMEDVGAGENKDFLDFVHT